MPVKGTHRVGWMSLGTRTKRRGQRVTKKYAKRYPHLVKQVFSKPKKEKEEVAAPVVPRIKKSEKQKVREVFNDYFEGSTLPMNFNVRRRLAALRDRPGEYMVILDYAGKETENANKYGRIGFIVNINTGTVSNASTKTLAEFLQSEAGSI